MKFLVYDTETTGLLPKKKGDYQNYPYIVQFSYIVYDDITDNIIKVVDEIIHIPDNVEIPEVASNIHNITTEMARNSKMNIIDCLLAFLYDCKEVDMVIGHNLEFDNEMVRCELERYKNTCEEDEVDIINLMSNFVKMKFYCTMKETIKFCNLVSFFKNSTKTYIKYPKLIELHDKLFGENTLDIQLHNSLNDVFVCFRCFYKYKYDKDMISKFPSF